MPIDKTKVLSKGQVAEKVIRDFLAKVKKDIGYSRDELFSECKITSAQWDHYKLGSALSDCKQLVNGKVYYFNPKYL